MSGTCLSCILFEVTFLPYNVIVTFLSVIIKIINVLAAGYLSGRLGARGVEHPFKKKTK